MTAEIKDSFSALTDEQQAVVLAAYAQRLTVVAHEGYEAGTERLSDPSVVRRVNELQHRVAGAILSRLTSTEDRYPYDVLVDIIVGEDDGLGGRLHSSFRRAWRVALGVDMGQRLPG